jgi:hypothetical protein
VPSFGLTTANNLWRKISQLVSATGIAPRCWRIRDSKDIAAQDCRAVLEGKNNIVASLLLKLPFWSDSKGNASVEAPNMAPTGKVKGLRCLVFI